MKIHLLAVGTRMPVWVQAGYGEYAKRLPPECELRLVEVAAGKRGKNFDVQRTLEAEGRALLARLPPGARTVCLDVTGKPWSTAQLAQRLQAWMASGTDVGLMIGGPEGLSPECKARADETWSLSPLTLPHPLVRIVVAEALYRAWSLLNNHPYHRD
jgi:23S rRNA (pseudouridine1915-N3)-methyltransferase